MARTILIVDDDAGVRETLQSLLEPEGHDVIQAEDGEQAIALANTFHIDAFLIDVQMPRINGLDMRRVLKQYLSKRTLEVVEDATVTGNLPPPEEKELAICFTDMRGFTAFSEETESTRLFSLISALLAAQVNLIHEFGGYVDKFGG